MACMITWALPPVSHISRGTINVMYLNHPKTSPLPWSVEKLLPCNQSLVPRSFGTAALKDDRSGKWRATTELLIRNSINDSPKEAWHLQSPLNFLHFPFCFFSLHIPTKRVKDSDTQLSRSHLEKPLHLPEGVTVQVTSVTKKKKKAYLCSFPKLHSEGLL